MRRVLFKRSGVSVCSVMSGVPALTVLIAFLLD